MTCPRCAATMQPEPYVEGLEYACWICGARSYPTPPVEMPGNGVVIPGGSALLRKRRGGKHMAVGQ